MLIPALFCRWNFSGPVFGIPAITFWPYIAGGITLAIGLFCLPKRDIRCAGGLDKLFWFAPLLVAIAMAIFGADHFTTVHFVAMIVPAWMPWRLFWAYFVGCALLASALSLSSTVRWRLAATLLGSMLLLFVVLMHIPNLIREPQLGFVRTLILRDTALGAGILSFGISRNTFAPRVIAITRFLLAFPIAIFGFELFRHPALAPGFPQEDPTVVITLPAWIPVHALWTYMTGAIFIACAVGLTTKRYARVSAKTLGVTVLVSVFLAYLPRTINKAADVAGGLNYLAIHCALAGAALMLAASIPSNWMEETSRARKLQEVSVSR